MVPPAEEFERRVAAPASSVAGVVQTAAGCTPIGIGDETLGGRCRLPHIAAGHIRTPDIETTDSPQRHRQQVPVEQIDTRASNRPTERYLPQPPGRPLDLQRQHTDRGLGRTIVIDHPAARPQRPHALHQPYRTSFTPDHQQAARQKLARIRSRRHQSGEVRRNDLQAVDRVQCQVAGHPQRVRDPVAADHMQRAAAAESAEDRRVAEVGGHRADGRIARLRPQAKTLPDTVQVARQLFVRDRHPLGPARRARGVDEISAAGGIARRSQQCRPELLYLAVEKQEIHAAFLPTVRQTPLGHQHGGAGIHQHLVAAAPRRVGIERYVVAPRLQHAKDCHRHFHRGLDAYRDSYLRADATRGQETGQTARPTVELSVAQPMVLEDYRHRIALEIGLVLKTPVSRKGRSRRADVVPLRQELVPLTWRQQSLLRDRSIRALDATAQEVTQVSLPALDRRGIEKTGLVGQRAGQTIFVLEHVQGEIEFGRRPASAERLKTQSGHFELL